MNCFSRVAAYLAGVPSPPSHDTLSYTKPVVLPNTIGASFTERLHDFVGISSGGQLVYFDALNVGSE